MFSQEHDLQLKILTLLKKTRTNTADEMDYKEMENLVTEKIGPRNKTLIHYLAEHGCMKALERLNLNASLFRIYEEADADGCTPLHLACQNLQYATANFLITETDNLIAENDIGMQPLMYLQQEQDKIFATLGLSNEFFARAYKERTANLAIGKDAASEEVHNIVRNKQEFLASHVEIRNKLAQVYPVIEELKNAIHNKFNDNTTVAIIAENGHTKVELLQNLLQSNQPGLRIHIHDKGRMDTAVPFIGDGTKSLQLRQLFITEFQEFLPTYKNNTKEHSILKSLMEIPINNWIEAANKIIQSYESRQKKLKLKYDESFVGLIGKLKKILDVYSIELASDLNSNQLISNNS